MAQSPPDPGHGACCSRFPRRSWWRWPEQAEARGIHGVFAPRGLRPSVLASGRRGWRDAKPSARHWCRDRRCPEPLRDSDGGFSHALLLFRNLSVPQRKPPSDDRWARRQAG